MKCLLCSSTRQIIGGADTYVRAILPRLVEMGYRVSLAFENDTRAGPSIDQGVSLERTWHVMAENRADVLAAIHEWRPDVVFNNGMLDVDLELQLTHYPVVYFAHNYVGTCVAGSKRHAWPASETCSQTFGPACLAYYFPRRCGGLNPLTMVKSYVANHRRLAMLRVCTQLVVASEAMRAEYLRHRFAAERVVLNPLFPVSTTPDPQPPTPRAMSGIVLLAGRLTQHKGGVYLVKALHRIRVAYPKIPPLQLAIVGAGPETPVLRALAEKLGVSAQFHGWADRTRLETLMRGADLLAMPSLWPEPFGLLGLEAGSFGVPSVGYAHGGIPDWLVEGRSGALAPSPPNVEGLAQAIVRVLSDPQKHHAMRVGAWEIAQQFSAKKHLRRLDDVLRSAATSRPH